MVTSTLESRLSWDCRPAAPRLQELYDRARLGQWNAATDIDWDTDVEFGSPIGADSAFAETAFSESSLARFGPQLWQQFRWEFQAWMTSDFLTVSRVRWSSQPAKSRPCRI